jgi:hypothetical protein
MKAQRGPSADARKWDRYVESRLKKELEPGEEWGTPESWHKLFDLLIKADEPPQIAVEIGQGSGKYTRMVLDEWPQCRVLCFDVSPAFLSDATKRLAGYENRVSFHEIGTERTSMDRQLEDLLEGQRADLVFSMDAMVHVDQQMFVEYVRTTSIHLKRGGRFSATLASLDTDAGLAHLLQQSEPYYSDPGFTGRMVFWSPSGVIRLLDHFGLRAETMDTGGRDILLTARKQ